MMKNPKISMVVAISENNIIGNKGEIPWHIPEDLKRFRKLTEGHVVVMGRKTFESIGRILPNRINIVITKDKNYTVPKNVQSINQMSNLIIANSIEEAIELARKKEREEIFIIGGGKIFEQSIKFTDKLYLTIVKGEFAGDTFFPDYSEFNKCVFKKESKDKNYRYIFLNLEK